MSIEAKKIMFEELHRIRDATKASNNPSSVELVLETFKDCLNDYEFQAHMLMVLARIKKIREESYDD